MGRGPGVRARGARAIYIDFRYRGVRCQERLALAPTKANLKYAERLKATVEHEIVTGTFDYRKRFPHSQRRQRFLNTSQRASTGDFVHSYVESISGEVEVETLNDYREYVKVIRKTDFGKLPVEQLTRQQIRSWVKDLGVSAKRLNNLLIPLRGALRQALDDGILTENPLLGFKVGKQVAVQRAQIDPLTPAELKALAGTAHGYIWIFWAWTGLRTSELIGLQWEDCTADGGTVRIERAVREGRTKATKTISGRRTIRLLPPAREALAGLPRGEGTIFLHPRLGAPFHSDKPIRLLFHADCEAANVRQRPGPNQLRHTFASLALSAGEPLGWVSATMGHKDSWVTLQTYARWIPSAFPDAGKAMTGLAK